MPDEKKPDTEAPEETKDEAQESESEDLDEVLDSEEEEGKAPEEDEVTKLQKEINSLLPFKKEVANYRRRMRSAEKRADDAEAEASTLRTELVSVRVRQAANGKLADPTDAAIFLDLTEFTSETPEEEISQAIDKLVEEKPHLAFAKKRGGGLDQGPQGDDSPPSEVDSWLRSAARPNR